MSTYETISLLLETLVVVILVIEFGYDAWWNSKDQRIKRRKKKEVRFEENLTQGEHK